MNKEEKVTNYETLTHINNVRDKVNEIVTKLLEKAENHDKSKMEEPELTPFVKMTPLLAKSTYGSEEYDGFLEELKPALDHHYAKNTHHPEHHKQGVGDMTLIDIVEMLCDWKSATMRHNDGNLRKSIEINGKRFKINSQLIKILENTVKEMGW